MYDGIEKKILKEMSERLVARKIELWEFAKKQKISESAINTVTRMMVQKGLLTTVYASESTFAITQKGMREASRLE